MKVEIPFVYTVDYKKPRQPSWSSSQILCTSVVDMEVISDSDAPIVHIVADSSAGKAEVSEWHQKRETVSKFHVPGGDCLIRKRGGQYYASRFPVDEIAKWRGNKEFDPFSAEVALRPGDSEHRAKLDTAYKTQSATTLEQFHALGEVKKFTSGRAMTDRYLQMFAGEFAVVDGVLYEKVAEPVISAVVPLGSGTLCVYVEEATSPTLTNFSKGDWRGKPENRLRYGLDEFDRAIEECQEIVAGRPIELAVYADVKQVSPTEVEFRGDHEYLYSAATQLAYQLSAAAKYMTERAGTAVVDAANLLAVHDRLTRRSLAAVRRMETELRSYFAGDHPAPPTQEYKYDYDLRQAFGEHWREKLDRLSHALEHWDVRDDVGLEWFDRTMDALPLYDYPKRAYEISSVTDMGKLAMRWKGTFPRELGNVDFTSDTVVVVEDFEEYMPLAAMVYDRSNMAAPPVVFGNPDPQTVASEAALADAFVRSAKADLGESMSFEAAKPIFLGLR